MNLKMIRSGIVAAALAVAPFAAQAADLPGPSYKAPAYVSPWVFSWSGFYVGLNAGYAFGNSHWDSPTVDPSVRRAVIGGTVGYNLQTGRWVWGIEGDLDYSAAKGSAACGPGTCETAMTWLGTARGRLGYGDWSTWLPYVTGGLAFGGVKATNSAVASTSTTRLGWTIGAGLEYALFSNCSVKTEYLYVDLGKFNCSGCNASGIGNVTYHTSIVRAGLNYHF